MPEGEETVIEKPIDQRKAEIVEDEVMEAEDMEEMIDVGVSEMMQTRGWDNKVFLSTKIYSFSI